MAVTEAAALLGTGIAATAANTLSAGLANRAQNRTQRWQQKWDLNQYQYTTADMAKAGINPAMASGVNPGSTSVGMPNYQTPDFTPMANAVSQAVQSEYTEKAQAQQDRALDLAKQKQDAEIEMSRTELTQKLIEYADKHNLNVQELLNKAKESGLIDAQTANTKATTAATEESTRHEKWKNAIWEKYGVPEDQLTGTAGTVAAGVFALDNGVRVLENVASRHGVTDAELVDALAAKGYEKDIERWKAEADRNDYLGPQAKNEYVLNKLAAAVADRKGTTKAQREREDFPKYPAHGQTYTAKDGTSWLYDANRNVWYNTQTGEEKRYSVHGK